MRRRGATIAMLALCSGCMNVQSYEGERRPSDEVARISGDIRFSGAPLSVILRQVDERVLNVGQSSVDVLPGSHTLLVDCRIAETDSVTRHSLEVEVAAGRHYKLTAEAGPGFRGCVDVSLLADGR
jgi:hypothetical protein